MAELIAVDDPTHPLLADFVALNDPERRRSIERSGDHFVVEGTLAIERLLSLGSWRIRSLALLPRMAERLAPLLSTTDAPVAVASPEVLEAVVGFHLHRGALASVWRRPAVPASAWMADASSRAIVLAAEGVNDHENLGALYRNAAAFGAAAVALDPTCADPFYRRSVRVSLGHVLAIPTLSLDPTPAGLEALQANGGRVLALTPAGDVSIDDLGAATIGDGPVTVLVGAEGPGLAPASISAADLRVRIPIAPDVDSLNVAVAAALALHRVAALRSA